MPKIIIPTNKTSSEPLPNPYENLSSPTRNIAREIPSRSLYAMPSTGEIILQTHQPSPKPS